MVIDDADLSDADDEVVSKDRDRSSYRGVQDRSRSFARRRRGKNLHEYSEEYFQCKEAWRSKRSRKGRGYPSEKRHNGEPGYSQNFESEALLAVDAKANVPTNPSVTYASIPAHPGCIFTGNLESADDTSMTNTCLTDTSVTDTSVIEMTETDTSVIEIFPEDVEGAVAITDSTFIRSRSDNLSSFFAVTPTTGIVSRPGNARGGRVYVPAEPASLQVAQVIKSDDTNGKPQIDSRLKLGGAI